MSAVKYVVLCLGIVAASIQITNAIDEKAVSKIRDTVLPHLTECAKEFNADTETLKEAREKGDAGAVDSCFFACVFRKTGLMNAEGNFDKDVAIEKAKQYLSDDDLKGAEEVASDCIKVNEESVSDGEKGCERGLLMFKCLISHKDKFTVTGL